jgi:Rne/Rng family ribonuclease
MNKELYVSTTPHETKVGITEDDQLAEIYLERENEYTLAGSIYKGRVTRVLPGMQSAFVDIGLERDAFLYVSDFMDLEQQDEDLDEAIPANRPVQAQGNDVRPRNGQEGGPALEGQSDDSQAGVLGSGEPRAASSDASGNGSSGRDFRGRRRRRGRRGETGGPQRSERPERGELKTESTSELPESPTEADKEPRSENRPEIRNDSRQDRFNRGDRGGRGRSDRFQRPAPPTARPGRDYDYGPPPGYQPIVLPGESISKYQKQAENQSRPQSRSMESVENAGLPEAASILTSFPEDEPIFASASSASEPLHEQHDHESQDQATDEGLDAGVHQHSESQELPGEATAWERVKRALFTSETAEEQSRASKIATPVEQAHLEEQVIEEEEAELTSYGEEPGDDEGFEELEEETRAASDEVSQSLHQPHGYEAHDHEAHEAAHESEAQVQEPHAETDADSISPLAELAPAGEASTSGEAVPEAVLEAEEREAEEMELEEAQAEAEALLEAEAIGAGTMDASAEVRGPAPEAMLTQRTQRRGPERGFDRGRGRRGGRRFRSRENRVVPQISELLKEGQEVLIQIAKEPIAKKGARITSHIALPGRFLVFMPTVNHTGVSRKIASEEERQRLKRIIQSERENGSGGFIVRTAAAGASDEELRADIRFLKNLWNEIKARSDSSKAPALIYHDLNVVERVLRDQVSSDFSVIWVDTEQEYERIVRFANRFQPGLVKRVKLYTKETPLYDQFGLNEEINKALKSKVWLKSGGYIVINQTEALVAIDVNTGKYVGKTARLEDTIVKTNVDAIKEIVRQVRLRDLGGIIIIDFIDMDERRNRQKVMQALEEALRFDRAPSKVLQFNDFGLVAITRKRVKQSLERTIGTPCPYCQSTGFVKSVNTVCNEVYVEMRKISSHLEHSDVMLRVNPEVAKALKLNNAKLLNEMEELTKKTIIVKSDPALHQEQFDIH